MLPAKAAAPEPKEVAAPAPESKETAVEVAAAAAPAEAPKEKPQGTSLGKPATLVDAHIMALKANKEFTAQQQDAIVMQQKAIAALKAERDEARSEAAARQKDLDMAMADKVAGADRRPGVTTRETWETPGKATPDRTAILAANSVMEAALALKVEASDDVRNALEAAPEAVRSFLKNLSSKAVTAAAAPKQSTEEAILAKELQSIAQRSKELREILSGTAVTAAATKPAAHAPGVHARDEGAPVPSGKRVRRAEPAADEAAPAVQQVQAGRQERLEMLRLKSGAYVPTSNIPLGGALMDALRSGSLSVTRAGDF